MDFLQENRGFPLNFLQRYKPEGTVENIAIFFDMKFQITSNSHIDIRPVFTLIRVISVHQLVLIFFQVELRLVDNQPEYFKPPGPTESPNHISGNKDSESAL